jgi:nitroimidazol reductase NimA-like FMN-containing flavoprotein (pyridoxamine 5'-phosphate oxidase superfamily)
MADHEPMAAQPFSADDARPPVAWAEARRRLEEADTYWLATARPDGRPHVVPVLAVWVDDALHVSAGAGTRKGRNLARDPRCVVVAGSPSLDLVLEGRAAKVTDEAKLRRVAEVYAAKYRWQVTVRDGALHGDGAPTAGPPPYDVYEVTPTTAFGFGTDESFNAMRWRFQPAPSEGPGRSATPRPENRPLDALVGTWRSEGEVLAGPSGRATRITGTDAYEWLPGGFFLLHHVDVHVGDEKVDAVEVIGGYDAATGTYPMRSFDNQGNFVTMRARVNDAGVWSFTGESERTTLVVGDDGTTMTAHWEQSGDGGSTWRPWMEMRFTKVSWA